MTPPLLARLFVVPAMIVAVIVACTVVVILLFGSITAEKDRSLEELVDALEAASGQPNFFGGYWPKDKEVYHAERELLLRLRNNEVPAEQRPELARRLAAVLRRAASVSPREETLTNERCLMLALGHLEEPTAVDVLLYCLDGGGAAGSRSAEANARRQYAAEALALLKDVPESRRSVPDLARMVQSSGEVKEVRMVAAVAVSCLAAPGDVQVVDALKAAYYSDDRELKWNAALGLARLGDATAVSLLKEMLRRSYWEQDVEVRLTEPGRERYDEEIGDVMSGSSRLHTRKLTPVEVGGYLAATIEATASLGLPELNELIAGLKDDSWPDVRQKAASAAQRFAPQAESARSGASS